MFDACGGGDVFVGGGGVLVGCGGGGVLVGLGLPPPGFLVGVRVGAGNVAPGAEVLVAGSVEVISCVCVKVISGVSVVEVSCGVGVVASSLQRPGPIKPLLKP